MKSQLAFELTMIAKGDAYYELALYQAANHPVCTANDEQMLRRYYHGIQKQTDHIRLQELANYIEEYDTK